MILQIVGRIGVLAFFISFNSCSSTAKAESPPQGEPQTTQPQETRGAAAQVEIEYLTFIIDHHFSALRMTELAAGTDGARDQAISPAEGTSPSPGFESTPTRAASEDLRSMARSDNRLQREEILRAQKFLREWYGVEHQPQLSAEGSKMITELEVAGTGAPFDRRFMELMSSHHVGATMRSVECLSGRVLEHGELRRYCRNILDMQLIEIDELRHMLCSAHQVCDFVPSQMQ